MMRKTPGQIRRYLQLKRKEYKALKAQGRGLSASYVRSSCFAHQRLLNELTKKAIPNVAHQSQS